MNKSINCIALAIDSASKPRKLRVLVHAIAALVLLIPIVSSAQKVVARLRNNGQTRAPGIHIGAYRENDTMQLQMRWDLRAMAKAREQARVK